MVNVFFTLSERYLNDRVGESNTRLKLEKCNF